MFSLNEIQDGSAQQTALAREGCNEAVALALLDRCAP
jgi:hypothetical protein